MLRLARIWQLVLAASLLIQPLPAQAASSMSPLVLYLDGDFSKNEAASASIELGIRTALAEVDNRIGGMEVAIQRKDHRGNVRRSHRHFQDMVESETALAMFGGMASPPYLTHQAFINENRLPVLLTWSAAGPITRPGPDRENWIFRLSVDDTKSGPFLANAAADQPACHKISLLLLDTGWGHASRPSLEKALVARGKDAGLVLFLPSNLGEAGAGMLADTLAKGAADCIIMLASAETGALMVNAIHKRLPKVRIFSHWGIMGGGFVDRVPHDIRTAHHLAVLQTCGLRQERQGNPRLRRALSQALPEAEGLADVPAPTGFVHGYDMTRLMIAAADQAALTPQWSGDIKDKRLALHGALERLEPTVHGILKTYVRPFTPYTDDQPDAHEALNGSDLCLARFTADGQLEDLR